MLSRLPRAPGALTAVIAGITALSLVPAGAATVSARLPAGRIAAACRAGRIAAACQAGRIAAACRPGRIAAACWGRSLVAATRPAAGPDASVPCGVFCASYFTEEYGPEFVLNDFRGRQVTGTRVTLRYASNSDPAEDWSIWPAGTVRQLAAFGIVSQALALHYGADQAFEAELRALTARLPGCAPGSAARRPAARA